MYMDWNENVKSHGKYFGLFIFLRANLFILLQTRDTLFIMQLGVYNRPLVVVSEITAADMFLKSCTLRLRQTNLNHSMRLKLNQQHLSSQGTRKTHTEFLS